MHFIHDKQCPGAAGDFAQSRVITGVGMDDADVGHHRFGQHHGYIFGGQDGFQRGDIVELDDFGRLHRIDGRTQIAKPRTRSTFLIQSDESLIHRAMVAIVENQNFGPPGDVARHADGKAVSIGGRQRKCQYFSPKRRWSSSPTQTAFSVGSIRVMPFAA